MCATFFHMWMTSQYIYVCVRVKYKYTIKMHIHRYICLRANFFYLLKKDLSAVPKWVAISPPKSDKVQAYRFEKWLSLSPHSKIFESMRKDKKRKEKKTKINETTVSLGVIHGM